jgi:hypothetical protein
VLIIERGRAADVVKKDFVVIGKGHGHPHWLRRRLLEPVSASSHAMNVLRCVGPAVELPWERRLVIVATQDVVVHLTPGQARGLLGLNSKLLGLTRDQLVLRCQTAFESGHAVLQLVALLFLSRKLACESFALFFGHAFESLEPRREPFQVELLLGNLFILLRLERLERSQERVLERLLLISQVLHRIGQRGPI